MKKINKTQAAYQGPEEETEEEKLRRKSDTLMKGAIEEHFENMLRFFYPDADLIFDMIKGFTWMNKELSEIQPILINKGGSRHADVLVKVYLLNGSTELLMLHMEVQKTFETNFSHRVFVYWYRLFDKYRVPIVSLVLFTGPKNQQQPNNFSSSALGTELTFKYKTYQVFDHTEEELIAMNNPFALVIVAVQQEALYKKGKPENRLYNVRIKILRALAASQMGYEQKKSFLFFMDQLIPLADKELNTKFEKEIVTLIGGEYKDMGIMDAVRTVLLEEGEERGIKKGIEQGLELGRHEEALEIAREMKKDQFPIEQIKKLTKLSINEIKSL